ncbi:phosphotransferase family protein [Bacteroides sp. L10-4]|uniref:phosphotransferase family protein n=1 Tax=Bacteroides sp. L10-4 TaxID=2746063 RepID=UPI0020D239B5|nr:aminoglycoside phosphotransferase family protein [Bacteroides sp. L10-4]
MTYINKGVMTDTYRLKSGQKCYVVRCYPKFRSWLAKTEYDFLREFAKNGIKAPEAYDYKEAKDGISYLIYQWVEGKTLKEAFNELNEDELSTLCDEIIENYTAINRIETRKFGRVVKGRVYEHNTWQHFLRIEIEQSRHYFKYEKDQKHVHICDGLYDYIDNILEPTSNLVWGDFSLDNIIVTEDKHLAAFIDFEGMVSGDPLLGISYLLSQEPDHPFTKCILKKYGIQENSEQSKLLDFYAVFRYIRIAPYTPSPTPNGSGREPLNQFLPYVARVENRFENKCKYWTRTKRVIKLMWKKILVLLFSIAICMAAIVGTCCFYNSTLEGSQVSVKFNQSNNLLISAIELPSWFCVTDSCIETYKIIDSNDKKMLYSCVAPSDSLSGATAYNEYIKSVDKLAFKSNTEFPNTKNLLLLTLCMVALGCCARTFYDYIGWECYKNGQDMETWWSWYVFRPIIGCPIAAFLLVVFRTSMFSSLFTTKDLNTYLVVAFLTGFAMMEFLKMLRRSSKALFGEG